MSFNAQHHSRNRDLVLSSGLDHYMIQLFVTGTLDGCCDGIPLSVRPGEIYVLDLNRCVRSRATTGSTIMAILPRLPVDKATGGRNVHGTVLKAEEPVTRLLASFMRTLSALAPNMNSQDALAMEESAISLFATAVAGAGPEILKENPLVADQLHQRVLDFIDSHLTDPGLGLESLLQKFPVSRAHLYRFFAPDGGVVRIIREKRLDASYRQLVHPATVGRTSITEISHRYAFASSSQFLRAFRTRFGMTPSEARERGFSLELADRQAGSIQAHFSSLFASMGQTSPSRAKY